jgi:hypothetical protein
MNNLDKRILEITKVYDNNGETYDRYTVFTPDGAVYGMSEGGEGFNQYIGDYTEVEMGEHLGTKLDSVPESIKNAVLNRMVDSQFVDLFQYYELMPENVSSIFNMYYEMGGNEWDYDSLKKLEGDLEELGYTFDYGLDAEPYGLRPIELSLNQLKDFEEYENGGEMNDYTKSLGMVRVKFADSKYNYETNVSSTTTEEQARNYFVGKMFDVGVYPNENMQKVIDIDFYEKGTYAKGGGINSGRDNLFKSQEPHEQKYKRKREWKEYKKEGWFGDWYRDGGEIENKINDLYAKSNFINDDFNWKLKLLEMLQDQSIEAYNIYQKLSKEQKEDVLQEQFEVDNDMGSDGDGDIETSRENINILLEDAKNGKKYAKGGGINSGRDNLFKSQEPHEQRYKRKREWKEYKKEGWFGDWFRDGGVILMEGDMVKIMPNYPSIYTNEKAQIVREMPDGKTYEVKIRHKTGNEYQKFDKSELVFLGNEPKWKLENGGGVGDEMFSQELHDQYEESYVPIDLEKEITLPNGVTALWIEDNNGKVEIWKKGYGDLASAESRRKITKEQLLDEAVKEYDVMNERLRKTGKTYKTSRSTYAKGGGVAMGIKKGDLVFAKHEGTRGLIGLVLTNPKKDIYGETVVKVYFRGYRGDILETSVRDIVEIVKGEYVFRAIENGDILAYLSIANKNKYYINDRYENLEMDEYANGGVIIQGDLVKYNHSPRQFVDAKVLKISGNRAKIEILADYTPFTKRMSDKDDWFRTKTYADPSTLKKLVKRGEIKFVSLDKLEMFDEKRMSYYPEEQVFQSKEFNDAFKKYLKNKMANGGSVGNFSEYSNDALTDAIINLSRFENTEDDIQTLKEELKKRKESIKLDSIEEMVKSNLFNGEISCEKLTEIIGCKPNYPYQIVGAIKLEKCYLRPYYKLV